MSEASQNGRLSIDDLTGPEMRDLFRELDEAHKAASAAFAADDMEAWVEHAARGAELFEKFARLNGWRDQPQDAPAEAHDGH